MTTTDTPRTDDCPHCGAEQIPHITAVDEYVCETLISKGGGNTKRSELCRERERHQDALLRYSEELNASQAEVERLRDLLNRAINEIEKTPFHNPKLTAFTAHRLADRYRDEMTNTSTKPIEPQEDDK